MKISVSIDAGYPEDLEVTIHAQKEDPRIQAIESLLEKEEKLIGYEGSDFVVLDPLEVYYFATEDGKIYAHLKDKKYLVKKRIYELEAMVAKDPDYFLINQGALANLRKVEKMSASFNGSLNLIFLNGEKEYASRIQTSLLKKKLGL
jgi:DNA-binding LytR/AlgR family response regulator